MKNWKNLLIKVFFVPIWLIALCTIVTAIALVVIFLNGLENTLIAYLMYGFSAYSLSIVCVACWKYIPGYYRNTKEKVYDNKYANRYLTDVAYKTQVKLYSSLGINLLYVFINAISGIVYRTYWFGIFAVYYAIMAVMRFLLVRYVRENEIGQSKLGELKRARVCSVILLTVNMSLSGAVLMMVYFNRGFTYQGFLIYVVALYTFYITTTAIIDMVKYRKYKSPIMSVSKVIKFASALFSMLFLETAMFAQFGADTSINMQRIMIMITGAGISIIVVIMSIYMIVRTTKELKEIKELNNGKEE
ncbi:MAG: hypothetical protein J6L69_10725 [Lachnospiraceae bacterium]|nr:hypothetical protein [Lachnospiraceae bacterium]